MTGTLTGDETTMLRLLQGEARSTSFVLGDAMVQSGMRTAVRRTLSQENGQFTLGVSIRMRLLLSAGALGDTQSAIAAEIERSAANVIAKLQALNSDAIGFGSLAIRAYDDIAAWENSGFSQKYAQAHVRASADVNIL